MCGPEKQPAGIFEIIGTIYINVLGFSSDEMVEFQPNFSEKEQPVPVLVAKVVPYIDLEKLKKQTSYFLFRQCKWWCAWWRVEMNKNFQGAFIYYELLLHYRDKFTE